MWYIWWFGGCWVFVVGGWFCDRFLGFWVFGFLGFWVFGFGGGLVVSWHFGFVREGFCLPLLDWFWLRFVCFSCWWMILVMIVLGLS